ncbi:MAG: hypothetical protein WAM14_11580 [Candidatus Nitrosopolaris sp.]
MSRQINKSHLGKRHKRLSTRSYARGTIIPTNIKKRPEIILKRFDRDTAKKQIYDLINRNPKSRTSAIIERLRINPIQATEILEELESEGFVLSNNIEH